MKWILIIVALFSFNKLFKTVMAGSSDDQELIVLDYKVDKGFVLDAIEIRWGEDRELVRKKLGSRHKADDRTFDLGGGQNIEQRRDIYKDYRGGKNYFFLNYDLNGKIEDIEFHSGVEILINKTPLHFGEEIASSVRRLEDNGHQYRLLDAGNYLFPKLKMTISDSEHDGGEGHGLVYFYAASNIDHLLED